MSYFIRLHRQEVKGRVEEILKHVYPEMKLRVLFYLCIALSLIIFQENLVRIVEMGPFKHRIDDGLEARKLAYEIMVSLLEDFFDEMDQEALVNHACAGLSDTAMEIRIVCQMAIQKLCFIDMDLVTSKLGEILAALETDIFAKSKPNAVKQEIEKMNESIRSAVRLLLLIKKVSDSSDIKLIDIISKMKADGGLDRNLLSELESEVSNLVSL